MILSAIVAMSENRVIGRDNELPWRLAADLAHFKKTTWGKPILMGRKTYDSIKKILPGRRNVVITRNAALHITGATVVNSPQEAVEKVKTMPEAVVIGGEHIYKAFLPQIQRIYLTLVHTQINGDHFFPELNTDEWQQRSCQQYPADAHNEFAYSFILLERISGDFLFIQ